MLTPKKNQQRVWIGMVLIVVVWQTLHLLIDERLIPSPIDTVKVLIQLILSGELLLHSAFSLYRLCIAIISSLLLGVVTGIVIGMNKMLDEIFSPILYILFPVPKAALLPIIFVLFGLGDASKIILIGLILYFQIVLSVYDAVKNIGQEILLSAKTLRLSRSQLYAHIILPAILPNVLSALRTSVGIGIAVLFFAETYATKAGLGYFIMNHWSLLNYDAMYAGILTLGGIGYGIFSLIDWIRVKFIKW